jgi:stage II sporulation protein AA (anti-sigma F factor antagonist)
MSPETVDDRLSDHELMTIEAFREGGDTILLVRGDVDMATAPSLWESVKQVLPGSERVIVDLRDVGFLDSSGLSVFVRAHRRLCHAGGALVLRSPNPNVRRVLDLTGLGQVLTIES